MANNNQVDPQQQRTANHGRSMRLQDQQVQPPPPQRCPRCDSTNTKFCYYNNYSLAQPRYFCKGCRRYWTQGGTLRNVPVGGGCRKGKRPKLSPPPQSPPPMDQHHDQLSKSMAHAMPPLANSSSSRGPTTGLMISGGQNLMRAALPSNPYNTSIGGGGGLFSMPPQGGGINLSGAGAGAQFGGGGHMALLQGLNLQSNLRAQQQMIPPRVVQNVGSQIQQRPLGSWAQGFINNAGGASNSSMAPNSSFWTGNNNAVAGDRGVNNQAPAAATSSAFNLNQWNNNSNNQQGFDASRGNV